MYVCHRTRNTFTRSEECRPEADKTICFHSLPSSSHRWWKSRPLRVTVTEEKWKWIRFSFNERRVILSSSGNYWRFDGWRGLNYSRPSNSDLRYQLQSLIAFSFHTIYPIEIPVELIVIFMSPYSDCVWNVEISIQTEF